MAEMPETAMPEVVTEVRTFLIADIRGYTRYTQEHGDEAAARLASRFAVHMRRGVASRGGEVIELRGDEALAVFSSSRQALRAALDLQAAFRREADEDPSLALNVGIGLDAGEAIPVEGGYRGGALNLAARLCSLAAAGEVLASEGVTHLARKLDGLEYLERGLAPLKGFSTPVRIVEIVPQTPDTSRETQTGEPVVVAVEQRLPIGGFLGALPATALVGREAELDRILRAVDAAAGGSGQLVLLAGEPGVGKTRLAQEATLAARNRRFVVATGRCYEAHQTVPFYPFLDALASLYELAPSAIREQVPRQWPHLARLLPDLAAPYQPSGESQEEQQRLFRAVTGFLQAVAAEAPVALLLDDLHWADEASLELLQHLARHTRADRLFILGTYRDVDINRQHPLHLALRDLMREDLVLRVLVHRLPAQGTAALMAISFGGEEISDEFVQIVHERTEGNPFFVQHVLRVLVERGDVFQRGGQWDRKDVATIDVPESVLAVIGQQLAQLEMETQEILREASILGQAFAFDHLQSVGGHTEEQVERALEEAEARGLIRETGADSYAFDHALTQQALYAELPARRRRRLHIAAGEALEGLHERLRLPRSGEMAEHFLKGNDPERALRYTQLAAQQAAAAYALADAERLYDVALELATQLGVEGEEAEVRERRGGLRLERFRGPEAAADFDRLLTLARASGDRTLALEALLGLARAHYIMSLDNTDLAFATRCRELYDAAYALAEELNDKPGMIRALLGTRWLTDFWPDFLEQSLANRHQALALAEETGDEALILECKLHLWRTVDRSRGELWAQQLIERLSARQDFHRLNEHYFMLMWQQRNWGNYERAIDACDAGIRVAAEIDLPPVQYATLKAVSLTDLGRYGEAREALRQEVADEAHPFGRAMQELGRGYLLLNLMAYDQALSVLDDAYQRASAVKRGWMRHWIQEMRVQALARSGLLRDGELRAVEQELADVGSLDDPAVVAEAMLALGNAEEALVHVERAIEAARSRSFDHDLLAALVLKAEILLHLGSVSEAITVDNEALTLATRTRALPLLWQVQRLRALILRVLGNPEAHEAQEIAEEIVVGLAQSIDDPELRSGFLEQASRLGVEV